MRITFLLPGYAWKPVGGYRVVYEYANQLVRRGHDVAVVHARRLPRGSFPIPESVEARLRWQADALRNLFFRPRLRWQFIDSRVQLLYVPNLSARHIPEADAIFATWWATAEAVVNYPPEKGHKGYLIQSYEAWGGPQTRVDATWRAPLHKVVIARWLYQKGLSLGVPPSEMVHIPNGIDHSVFRLRRPIEGRPPKVAMLYSALAWKGGAHGINALEVVKARFPSIEAVLFGVESRPRGLPRWIEYLCNPSQDVLVEQVYNGSSIYLCPSWTEGWHLPPAEAMACGCAVVSTDIGGVRDYAVDGETALLAPPREPERLANRVLELLRNPDRRAELAAAGHKSIQRFSWDRSASLFDRALTELTAGESVAARAEAK